MQEYIYVVTDNEGGDTSYYWTFDKAVSRARTRFDDWDSAEWSELSEGRHGYWKGFIDGEFQLVFVEPKNIF